MTNGLSNNKIINPPAVDKTKETKKNQALLSPFVLTPSTNTSKPTINNNISIPPQDK